MGRLEGKVAVVTGAGSGTGTRRIGRVRAGGRRGRAGRDRRRRAASSSRQRSAPPAAGRWRCRPTSRRARPSRRWCERAVAEFGVGRRPLPLRRRRALRQPSRTRRLTEMDDAVWQRMIDLVLTGTFHVCKHVGRQMLRQRRGSIILTATTDALIGVAGLDAYTAAKGGVVALTRSFAAGMAPDGVRVNAVCPAFVATEPQMMWLDDPAARAVDPEPAPAADPIAGGGRAVRRVPGVGRGVRHDRRRSTPSTPATWRSRRRRWT